MRLVKTLTVMIGSGAVVMGWPGCTYPPSYHGVSFYPLPGGTGLWDTIINTICGFVPQLPGCPT
jgi:hypothetical protein